MLFLSEKARRKKISDAAKLRWARPEFKARMAEISETWKKQKPVPQLCACGCGEFAGPGKKFIVGHNSRIEHPMLGKKLSEEAIQRLKEINTGRPSTMKGKAFSEEVCQKMSNAHKGVPLSESHNRNSHEARKRKGYRHSPETRKKIGAGNKGKIVSEESKMRCSLANKGKRYSPRTQFTSESLKKRYRDPVYVKKMKEAWNIKPNKLESRMIGLLDNLYPGEWKYTGDFSFTINGKCPDFVNCNGQKKVIELFGDYWHQGQDPQERINAFTPFGYSTLVIWEHEFKNMRRVINKIDEFMR